MANYRAPIRGITSHFVPVVPKNTSVIVSPHQNARSFDISIQNYCQGGEGKYQSKWQN